MQINIIDPKNWNVVQAKSDLNKKYYENNEYHMATVDSRLKIKIKNIDRLNQKVFIEFIYDNREKIEMTDFREDYIYEIDVNQDVSYALKINGFCEENNTKFVKFECGYLDKARKQKETTPKTQKLISRPITQEQYRSLSSLKIFLCHSSGDKAAVRDLYQRLRAEGFKPWLDEDDLLPGQEWQMEIPKAVKKSDIVIVCLSRSSINKEGYVQKEIKYALDAADEKPEGIIFIIPLKLEECNVPERLSLKHWVNLYEDKGFEKLMRSLQEREIQLKNK